MLYILRLSFSANLASCRLNFGVLCLCVDVDRDVALDIFTIIFVSTLFKLRLYTSLLLPSTSSNSLFYGIFQAVDTERRAEIKLGLYWSDYIL